MLELLDRYTDWTHSLKPTWVGLIMFLIMFLLMLFGTLGLFITTAAFIIVLTQGWALLSVPVFLLYTVYLAFNQEEKKNE